MKICTIFTGGTIGSVLDESGYIGPKEGTPFRLLQLYREQFGDEVEFEVMEPYRILSENLTAHNILLLKNAIQEALTQKEIQGIVVTHGTDTLQYSAAVLGYLFGDSSVPVLLVSSNYVLDDNRANGLVNFRYAVEFIREKHGKGVFVSYCNAGEFPVIHRATRLQPPVPYSDYVSSVCNMWYGRYPDGRYMHGTSANKRIANEVLEDGKFENKELEKKESGFGRYDSNLQYGIVDGKNAMFENPDNVKLKPVSGQILRIQPYVGMVYPELTSDTKVILHGSFHSGTICVDEQLKRFSMEAGERGIPFYLTGLLTEADAYETVKNYEKLGIIPIRTSAEIAQYCKLWLAVSNGLDVKQIMNTSIAEDWIPFFG